MDMQEKEHLSQAVPIIITQHSKFTVATTKCDACSPVIFTTTDRKPLTTGNPCYMASPELIKQPFNSRYYAVLSPYKQDFSVLNDSALTCLQYFNFPQKLESLVKEMNLCKDIVDTTLMQMVELGLLVPEEQTEVCTPYEMPETLAAWLHLTDRCTLRCAYCYLPHANADMSLETGKATIASIFRSASVQGYQIVKFKYAGGEPLLRFPLIQELHRHAQQLAEQHEIGLDGVVLSNGTLLTRNMVRQMQALGMGMRCYPDGRDSSAEAMRAIELTLECGSKPDISITVTNKSVQQLPELLAWVVARDLPFILNFYRPSTSLRVTEYDGLKLEEETFIEGMLSAYKVIEANLPRRSLLASLADMANFAAPHLRWCSVGHSYLVFDTEVRVSKCQMQMDKPVTDIHAKDPLAVVRADACGIQNLTVDEKEGCQDCQWKYWCGGGCPLETYRLTGRYDLKSPNCNIYKALYPEVLRLEGLRLLKYAGEEIEH